MKHIKLFEQFINEAKDIDKDLAQITLAQLLNNGDEFREVFYLSMGERDQIKSQYSGRLPRGFAGPNTGMMSGSILSVLANDSVYVDGNKLVKGDKTVMNLKANTTWDDVAKALKL